MSADLDPVTEFTLFGCWMLFVAVWVAGWIYNLMRAPKARRRKLSPWIFVGGAIAYAISWLVPSRVWDFLAVDHWAFRDIGVALVLGGTAFAIWARIVLGTMWSGIPSLREGHCLRTTGPFSITRHPIYTGFLAMLIGTALVYGLGSWTGPVVAGAIALFFKIRDEEKLMLETFGEQYETYRSRVYALVPFPRFRYRTGTHTARRETATSRGRVGL
jgi:protein-S-isoprenylcysteine O-methyltransferase Ste14